MRPLVRWTIGPVLPAGYDCLVQSVLSFQKLYEAEIVICYNGQDSYVESSMLRTIHQETHCEIVNPIGVAWKLCPPRVALDRHEIFIDNDLIIEQKIDEIDQFLSSDSTLLLETKGRNYGRFERHVPQGYEINSGIFGLPPGFNLEKYIKFYGTNWSENVADASRTHDEQGLVATALLSYRRTVIIPRTTITDCGIQLHWSSGMHFIGLNRYPRHIPWLEYQTYKKKLFI